MKQSLQNTLGQTDVWKNDPLVMRLNGAGVNNLFKKSRLSKSPTRSIGNSRASNYEKDRRGHNPISTVRDKDIFSMMAGVS